MRADLKLIEGTSDKTIRFEACLKTVMHAIDSEDGFYMDRLLIELIFATSEYNFEDYPNLDEFTKKITESYHWWREYMDE